MSPVLICPVPLALALLGASVQHACITTLLGQVEAAFKGRVHFQAAGRPPCAPAACSITGVKSGALTCITCFSGCGFFGK
mmetsp:Transcript_56861/g.100461  ORF Transcript_56861/g.100461 Transcript_56861/m.100461 type:complete len:80 (-) Transcript_56861:739-978(-)